MVGNEFMKLSGCIMDINNSNKGKFPQVKVLRFDSWHCYLSALFVYIIQLSTRDFFYVISRRRKIIRKSFLYFVEFQWLWNYFFSAFKSVNCKIAQFTNISYATYVRKAVFPRNLMQQMLLAKNAIVSSSIPYGHIFVYLFYIIQPITSD